MHKNHRKSAALTALLTCLPLLTGCAGNAAQTPAPAVTDAPAAETAAPETAAEEVSEETSESTDAPVALTDMFAYEAGAPVISGDREDLKNAEFYRDGIKIFGQLYLPESKGPFPIVIMCSRQLTPYNYYEDKAKKFSENGFAALIFDFIGVGRAASGCKMTDRSVLTEAQDINVIIDSLPDVPKIDTEKVFLWGHSLGGLAAVCVGCRRPNDIQGLMLAEPSFRYPDEVREAVKEQMNDDLSQVPETVPLMNLQTTVGRIFITDMYGLDIYSWMPDCTRDVAIFLGTEEDTFGAEYHDYFDRAQQTFPSATVTDIEGADHDFHGDPGEKMTEQCIAFMQAHI